MSDPAIASVTPIQAELFSFKMHKPSEGSLSFSNVKNVPLPHEQTATLVKREDLGEGSVVSLVGGTGQLTKTTIASGKIIWTLRVDDVEIDL